MKPHYAELAASLIETDFTPSEFSHRDHVAVAFEILKSYEFLEACMIYASAIRRLASRAGAADKFSMTITLAFMAAIAERMTQYDCENPEHFIDNNPDLLDPTFLQRWYSEDQLASTESRELFLMPRMYNAG
jgi:hypothetical protein